MDYTSPAVDAVDFYLADGYAAPAISAVNFVIDEEIFVNLLTCRVDAPLPAIAGQIPSWITSSVASYKPSLTSGATTETILTGRIALAPIALSGYAITTSFVSGNYRVNPPLVDAHFCADTSIEAYAPVIEATATTPIMLSGDFVAPGVAISADGYTWLVGTGALHSKLPTISGQVEQPKGIYGRLNSPLIRIAGTLLRTEYINGAVNVRPPKILAAVAIHD